MKDLNLKNEFFEMIAEEPLLQAKISERFHSRPEVIQEIAQEKNKLLSISSVREIIAEHYNNAMPAHLKIEPFQTLNTIRILNFNKTYQLNEL